MEASGTAAAASGKPGSPRGCLKTSSTPPKHRASKSLRFGADQFAPEQLEDDAGEPEPTAPSSPAAAAATTGITITVPDSPSATAAAAPASPAAAGSVAARAAMFQQRAAASASSGSPPLSPAKSPGGHVRSKTGVGAVYSPASSPSAAKVAGAKSPVRFAVPGAASTTAPAAAASPTAAAAAAAAAVVPPSPPSPHRRTQTVSVLERAKLFAAKPDTDSDEEVETPTAVQKRLSLAALTKEGTVSGLRNMLAEVGFDPAAAPSTVKDMIARGGKGQVKQEDSDGSSSDASSSEQDDNDDDAEDNSSSAGSASSGDSDSDSGEVVRGSTTTATAAAAAAKPKAAGGMSPTVKPAGRGHGRSKTGITREGSRGFGESSGGGFCAPPALNTAAASKSKAKKQASGQYVYRSGCEGAAVKLQTLARVLTARSAVRRKLVSEVTAFSMIMERGIQMTKHPFGSRARPKKVVLSIVQRRGVMQVC
jgi:hypothetical protein